MCSALHKKMFCAILILFGTTCEFQRANGQAPPDRPSRTDGAGKTPSVIDRIREEGLNHSQAMQTLSYLTDVIGPRLTGSPGMKRANEWTRETMEQWGLENAHLESWGPFGRGWTLKRFSVQIVSPQAIILIAYPKAWSPGFDEPFTAPVVWVDAKTEDDLKKYEGRLKGAIVLAGAERALDPRFEPISRRDTDTELLTLANAASGFNAPLDLRRATASRPAGDGPASQPASAPAGGRRGAGRFSGRILALAAKEGAAMVIDSSSRGDGGVVFVQQAAIPTAPGETQFDANRPRLWSPDCPKIPAQATMATEDFNRLVRMSKQGESLKMAVDMQVEFNNDDPMAYNTIAEIPGTDPDLKEQIVMCGGHMDSWQSATGATDNGVGAVVAMEAVRILKALDIKPRRTIRVGLWSGEEQGLLGSHAYVAKHFGSMPAGRGPGGGPRRDENGDAPRSGPLARGGRDAADESRTDAGRDSAARRDDGGDEPASRPARRNRRPRLQDGETGRDDAAARPRRNRNAGEPASRPASRPSRELVKGPDYEKLSVYFNLDNGTGKIRGIYMQGNDAARPYFRKWLDPFADLGASTLTPSNTGSTDHISFDGIGLPGFQFIQDPLDYGARTHHSSADVFDRIQADDVKQSATIMAAFLYEAAQMDERFPRKPLRAGRE